MLFKRNLATKPEFFPHSTIKVIKKFKEKPLTTNKTAEIQETKSNFQKNEVNKNKSNF